MRGPGPVPPSTRAAALTPSASASRTTVMTVGDFAPRSMSEIIEDEMPLRVPFLARALCAHAIEGKWSLLAVS
jgi:hypothetical protein